MTTGQNGDHSRAHPPVRRLRFDDDRKRRGRDLLGREHSGRRFVIAGVVGIFAVWGAVYLGFRDWRARHNALVEFGRREVGPAIDPMARLAPPGIAPGAWRQAVGDTHAMLDRLCASGLLDLNALRGLRDELRARTARATRETAVAELRRIWDDMEQRAGPVILRKSQRPPYPPKRPLILGKSAKSKEAGD